MFIKHQCQVCGKQFSYKHQLKSHMTKEHEGQQSFPCQSCGQLFLSCDSLRGHPCHSREVGEEDADRIEDEEEGERELAPRDPSRPTEAENRFKISNLYLIHLPCRYFSDDAWESVVEGVKDSRVSEIIRSYTNPGQVLVVEEEPDIGREVGQYWEEEEEVSTTTIELVLEGGVIQSFSSAQEEGGEAFSAPASPPALVEIKKGFFLDNSHQELPGALLTPAAFTLILI